MRGTYILVLELAEQRTLNVGALGCICFPEGIYAYVGSAQAGIEARVNRHRSPEKKLHWHIDYLLEVARVACTISLPIPGKAHECAIARSLTSSDDASIIVKGFGSSDCRCPSHLIYFGDIDMAAVVEFITWRTSMLDSIYPRSS